LEGGLELQFNDFYLKFMLIKGVADLLFL